MGKRVWVVLAAALALAAVTSGARLRSIVSQPGAAVAAEAGSEEGVPAATGKAADFVLPTPDGKEVRLSDLKGKVVVLSFWATWCPPCRKELPHLEALHKKYKDKPVQVLGVNLDLAGEDLARWLEENKVTFTTVADADGRAASAYGVKLLPTLVVVDQEMKIRQRIQGFNPKMEENLSRLIDGLLKGK
ncbi:MAG: TlpA family protein disulfide reductase [Armatimonadetes bacterium]|nr:TlpA family protein disulfide reductase [Armatimonadota bacterium]